jgi:hypothetical protein
MNHSQGVPDDAPIVGLVARFSVEQLAVIREVARGPRRGMSIARGQGITADNFTDEDFRVVWLALEVVSRPGGAPCDKVKVCRLCKIALEYIGVWSESDGGLWYAEKLAELVAGEQNEATLREAIAGMKKLAKAVATVANSLRAATSIEGRRAVSA